MAKVAFITLSNEGYIDYTLNCIASMRRLGSDGVALAERLVCYSIGTACHERLMKAGCRSVLIDDESNTDFQRFREGKWPEIAAYKLEIISRCLETSDFVCYTDGDIVYEDAGAIEDCVARAATGSLDLLVQNDSATRRDDDHSNICAGFMTIRSNETMRKIFHPESVRPLVNRRFCDQLYINNFVKQRVRFGVLPFAEYPNGWYFYEYPDNEKAKLVHFNYVVGGLKRSRMIKHGKWYLNEG